MSTLAIPRSSTAPKGATLQQRFLVILPHIEARARWCFRDLTCGQRRADAVAETVALTWKWFLSLARRGKDATRFASMLTTLAGRAVRSGRRLAGNERSRDALSPIAQARHGFGVGRLPDVSTLSGNVWDEALADNSQSAVPDQVSFRIDFPRWRRRQCPRYRRIIDDLVVGERTRTVARRHGLTSGRISQLRRSLHGDWERFCADRSPAIA
jgi:hypothetical protein